MKLLYTVLVAAAVAIPGSVFAQADQPLTRAQVREQIIELEQVGYRPGKAGPIDFPEELLAAEARVASRKSIGGAANGSSESGGAAAAR